MFVDEGFRTTLSSDLARAIVRMVNQSGQKPGDPLDSLKALAARFDVAVPTMREALRRLEGLGVVEFRHGSGIYVGTNVGRRVLANPVSPVPDPAQLMELLQARLHIEPAIAELAATAQAQVGLIWLEETLATAEVQVSRDDGELWRTNLNIHRAIAATSGNSILVEVLDSILLVHGDEQREILRIHGDAVEDFQEHRRLVSAIRTGDGEAARRISRAHLEHVRRAVRARGADTVGDHPARTDDAADRGGTR